MMPSKFMPAVTAALCALILTLVPTIAFAQGGGGGGGQEFNPILQWLVGALTGTLGKILAIAAVIVGAVIGVARQSLMWIALAIAFAVGLVYIDDIIDGIFALGVPIV